MSKEAEAAVKKGGKPKPATPIFPDKYLRGSSSDKEVVVSGQISYHRYSRPVMFSRFCYFKARVSSAMGS